MKWRIMLVAFTMVVLWLALVISARANLLTIGTANYNGGTYNLIYDNDSPFGSIVWLDYTRFEIPNYSADWYEPQIAWAASLNNAGVLTYNVDPGYSIMWDGDWRLPKTLDGASDYGYDGTTAFGYNIISSELGHLYYVELENKGAYDTNGNPQSDYGLLNTGPFSNLISYSNGYWSETQHDMELMLGNAYISFNTFGQQRYGDLESEKVGLAVRAAAVTPVPEPSSIILFGTVLLGLIGFRKFRK